MITVKQAARNAEQYLTSLVTGVTDIILEEVESADDEQFWFITLSYKEPFPGIQNIFGKTAKIFKIRKSDGEVVSMKIRKVG